MTLFNTLTRINSAYDFYKRGIESKKALEGPRLAFIENVANQSNVFDLEKALRFFEYTISADFRINQAKHMQYLAKAQLTRLLWKGEFYGKIQEFLPKEKIARAFNIQILLDSNPHYNSSAL